jgi:hypothetical protein
MGFEVAPGRLSPIGADSVQPRRVGGKNLLGVRVDLARQCEQRLRASWLCKLEIDPAAFLAAADQTRIGKDSHMPRHAGLALAQKLGQFADRQLHRTQQRKDAQARRIGQRLEKRGELEVPGHRLRI